MFNQLTYSTLSLLAPIGQLKKLVFNRVRWYFSLYIQLQTASVYYLLRCFLKHLLKKVADDANFWPVGSMASAQNPKQDQLQVSGLKNMLDQCGCSVS
jgi:hypothetical protein